MFSNFLEILTLSAIQGVTEFLPISSSAHLILVGKISNLNISSLFLDTGMHLGSLLAIIFYFKSDFLKILENKKLLYLIILGSLPTIFLGSILYITDLISILRNIEIIAWTSLIFAIFLYISDRSKVKKNFEKDINFKSILVIGLFQMLALIPGVSRSGIVITTCRFLNFNRYDSTKISLYLSLPIITGASFLSLKDLNIGNNEINLFIVTGIFFSFIFSYISIKYLLIFVQKFNLSIFVIYRIFLSIALFYLIYT